MDPAAAAAAVERANAALWAEKQRAAEAEARLQKRAEELHAARDRAVLEARRLRRALATSSTACASPTAAAAAPAVDSLSPLPSPSPPALPRPRRQLKSRLAPRRSGSSDEDDDESAASPLAAGSTPLGTRDDAATPLAAQRPPRSPAVGSQRTSDSPRVRVVSQQPRQAEVSPLEAAFAGFNRDMAEGLNAVGNLLTSPLRVLAAPAPLLPAARSAVPSRERQQEQRSPRSGA
jgi:hypothetical protein